MTAREGRLTGYKYRAFISYSWSDRAWGEWLHRALETYRTPSALVGKETPLGPASRTLHPIFKDREEEAAGHSIGASIEAAMLASEFMIVLCSPRSAQSKWVNREVAFFKRRRDPQKILTLIVDGEPGASAIAGREAEECFPKTLLFKVGDDLAPTAEAEEAPLAADARETGDGKRGAKLKLAAAMLGLGLDDLVRRDEKRRAARRRIAMAASLGLAAVLGALSIFAFNQRDAAVLARNEAVEAKGAAVKARDDAEGLIELILTDLKSDLEGYGTLKSVTAIGNRAIGYYEGQDVKALTPDQLGRRARVLLMLGEADNKRGDLDAALARYETAAATTGEQLARDPENPQRMFDHAQSVFWVGYIAWQRGDRVAAKKQFTEYHDLAQKLVASDPANEDWQAELDYAYSNLGTLAMDDSDAVAAEAWFRKSLEIALKRLESAPQDVERVRSAGQAYAWLADALLRQVRLVEAREARNAEITIYAPFISGTAPHASALEAASAAEFRRARIALAEGDLANAAEWARRAVGYTDELLVTAPDQTSVLERAALSRAALAEALILRSRLDEGRVHLLKATDLAERLIALDGANENWAGHVRALPKLLLARIDRLAGAEKPESLDDLISMQRTLIKEANNATIVSIHCAALAERGRWQADPADWREIIALLGDKDAELAPGPRAVLAEAFQRMGAPGEAARIVDDLYATGYRHPDFMALLDEFPNLKAVTEGTVH